MQLKVKHSTEIQNDQINLIIEPFQHLFNEKIIKDSSCLLSNEDDKRILIINKNTVELFAESWKDLNLFGNVIENLNVRYSEDNKINVRCRLLIGDYREDFNHILKNNLTGTQTEHIGFKYVVNGQIFYITLNINSQILNANISLNKNINEIHDITDYFNDISLIIEKEVSSIINDYVGR